jgi:uncharacterized protein YabE (DUF348 family)
MRKSSFLTLPSVRSLLTASVVLVIFGIIFISRAGAVPSDGAPGGRLVTFHDRGQERVILTHAETVRDALNAAHIAVVAQDTVEPGLDTPLVATDYTVNIYRARPVIVIDGPVRAKIMTAAQTPEGITKAAGIELHDQDTTTLGSSTDTMMADGASVTLTINRATAIHLTLYGTEATVYTRAKTVGDFLKAKGITLQSSDSLSIGAGTPITAGMAVAVWRNGVQTTTMQEDVDFTTQQVQNVDQPVGYKQVQTPGVKGKKSVTYQITMQNGKEVSRQEIQSVVLQQPQNQVEIIGTKSALPAGSHEDWMAAAGIAAGDYGYVNFIVSHEGGWEPCKVQGGAINCAYAANGGAMGYGVVQATPGIKMASAGADWATNPITQLRWATGYAVGRYGSWSGAYNYWVSHHNW